MGDRSIGVFARPVTRWGTVASGGRAVADDVVVADVPDTIVDLLYTIPPERFVAARNEAAARAKAAGDRATAAALARLRRPTIGAWLVNLLALRRPDLIAELRELGAALRAAQRELRGGELRELSARRRPVVAALVREAVGLAAAADPAPDPARLPLAEAESTLNAALSDERVAAQVADGRLLRTVAYAGFGEVPRPRLRLVTGGTDDRPAETGTGVGRRPGRWGSGHGARPDEPAADEEPADEEPADVPLVDVAALRRQLGLARTARKRAERDLERAVAAERDGAALLARIETDLADLERRRSAAEQELTRLKRARKAAERAAVAGRRAVGEAQAAMDHAGLDDDSGTPPG